jgi:serine/threonine protein kinase
VPQATELRPGQVIDGKYEILSLLGAGGMGEVFKVRHIHLNTLRTIKVMRRTLVTDETYRNRFAREARLATLLQHPNVALVYDFSTLPEGSYYMVSEFIDGVTVRQWTSLHGRLPPALAVRVAVQTLNGLEHIHRAGLLHRDLSADNIMISSDADGEPLAKIIDLGIAKRVTATAAGDATLAGIFVGNPRYSSPEQLGALAEGEEIDARADIYCFGVVLYEMLAGVAPFVSRTPEGYAAKHLAVPPPPLLSQPGTEHIPAELENIVAKALEKDRNQRYRTAGKFAAALTPFLAQAISETTQMKVSALHTGPQTKRSNGDKAPPATMTPPPADPAEQEAWEQASKRDTREALEDFLLRYPAGANASAASARFSELTLLSAVDRMAEQGDISSLSRLAAAHTSASIIGKAVRTALDRMADESLQPSDEKQAWLTASEAATDAAWTEYLSRFPNSSRAFAARLRRDELRDFASASRAGTSGAWRSFLQAWPESTYRATATENLRVIEEPASKVLEPQSAIIDEPHRPPTEQAAFEQTSAVVGQADEKRPSRPGKLKTDAPRNETPLLARVAAETSVLLLLAAFVFNGTRTRLAVALVVAAVLAAGAGTVIYLRLRTPDDEVVSAAMQPPTAAMQRSSAPARDTTGPAVPLVVTGKLVINAVPWGRIVSVHDGKKEWITSGPTYTPHTLQIPVGTYAVALLGPDSTRQSVVVGLTSTEPTLVRIDFHAERTPPRP